MTRSVQIAVRVVPELADLIDKFTSDATGAVRENLPGMAIGRADAVRILLMDGLERRGYDISDVFTAEQHAASSHTETAAEDRQLDLVAEAERRQLEEDGVNVEDDILSGAFNQSDIARRHECSRQYVSQVKKRLIARGIMVQRAGGNPRQNEEG
jgi:hypothetical protein